MEARVVELTKADIEVLRLVQAKEPEPLTFRDEPLELRRLWFDDLLDLYDMNEDGTRRWTLTPAGRSALNEGAATK
jgi:hypothetical protein